MRKLLSLLLCYLLVSPAWAGSGTVNYPSSGSAIFATTTDGSSNNVGRQTLWDYLAAANGLSIDTSHAAFTNVIESTPEGTTADAAYTGTGSASLIAIGKGIYAAATGPIPAGTNAIGSITNTAFGISGTLPAFAATPTVTANAGTGTFTVSGTVTANAGTNLNTSALATSANQTTANTSLATIAADPCIGTKTNLAISTSATALTQIIAASGSTKIYICSIALIAAGATAINLNTGTGTNCGTSTAALIGSTTAANGMSLAANGGFTLGNGRGTIAVTAASSELCTLQSNAVSVAGNLTYVQQ